MKINISNKEKINETIKNNQGKLVKVRLADNHFIELCLPGIEKRLELLLGGKKNWPGVQVNISRNFGPKPGSYRGTPDSTEVIIERFSSGWFMVGCIRISSFTNRKGDWQILLSDELKKQSVEYFLKNQVWENN